MASSFSSSSQRPDPAAVPSQDVMGSLLKQQRPATRKKARAYQAVEEITDPSAIAALLASCSQLTDETEDDLVFELLYLETLLMAKPMKSQQLLDEMGELGEDVRAGLLPPGLLDFRALRRRTRRMKRHLGALASRVTAAMLVFFTSVPLFGQAGRAEAKETTATAAEFQLASSPVIRVIDARTGHAVAGVLIKSTAEETLLGTTDAHGQATLSPSYVEADLLSLEKHGYQMYLLDRTQISGRNVVSMKPAGDDAHLATQTPKVAQTPVAPKVAQAPVAPKVVHENGSVHLEAPHAPVMPKPPAAHAPVPPKAVAPAVKHEAPKPAHALPPASAPAVEAGHMAAKPAPAAAHHAAAPHAAAAHEAPKPAAAHHVTSAQADKAPAHKPEVARPAQPAALEATAHEAAGHAAPAAPEPATHATYPSTFGTTSYEVKSGDTLSSIARHFLGSAQRWPELFRANMVSMKDPHVLHVGQILQLPKGFGGRATVGHRTYVVRPGDSLFTIASAQLGSGARWRKLYRLNQGRIPNPRYIFPGQTLQLPR